MQKRKSRVFYIYLCDIQASVCIVFCQQLTENGVPEFVEDVNAVVQSNKSDIVNSSSTIMAIVSIVNKISVIATTVSQTVMEVGDFLSVPLRIFP